MNACIRAYRFFKGGFLMVKRPKDIARGTACVGTLLALATLIVTPTVAHPGTHETVPEAANVAPAGPVATSTPVDTVLAFHAALANGDTDAALALMAENALIFESGGVERSRGEIAGPHLKANAEIRETVAPYHTPRCGGEHRSGISSTGHHKCPDRGRSGLRAHASRLGLLQALP